MNRPVTAVRVENHQPVPLGPIEDLYPLVPGDVLYVGTRVGHAEWEGEYGTDDPPLGWAVYTDDGYWFVYETQECVLDDGWADATPARRLQPGERLVLTVEGR